MPAVAVAPPVMPMLVVTGTLVPEERPAASIVRFTKAKTETVTVCQRHAGRRQDQDHRRADQYLSDSLVHF